MRILQPAVERFSTQFPRTVEKLTKLELHGVPTPLGFSRFAQFAGEIVGLPTLREPDDIDLFARNADFQDIAGILGVKISGRQIKTLITGDGLHLRFGADEILTQADGAPIQLVRPLSSPRDGVFCYHTAFTELAASQRTVFETNEGLVSVAHPADSMLIYGIGQRSNEVKNDAHNLALIRELCNLDDAYLQTRAAEVGADGRVWSFMAEAKIAGQAAARSLVAA